MSDLARITAAGRALAEVETVEDAKGLYDKLEALSQYARRYRVDHEKQNEIAELKLRTARKGGALLAETVTRAPNMYRDGTSLPEGISRMQSSRWQALASIPEGQFEEEIAACKTGDGELTLATLLRVARKLNRPSPPPPDAAEGEYPIVYCDPPWRYEHAPTESRAIENQYPTLSLDEIEALDVPAAEDAVLFMWATSPKLAEALEVVTAWGFEYRTCMVWVKDRIGMGYYVRQQHELLLIAKRGDVPVPAEEDRPSSVVHAPRGRHSEKPAVFYDLIERMYPEYARVELFARKARPGWSAWGNEAVAA